MEYLFKKVERTYTSSKDKTRSVLLYTNEGRFRDACSLLGSFEVYKDGSIKFECRGITKFIVSPEELQFISKCSEEL